MACSVEKTERGKSFWARALRLVIACGFSHGSYNTTVLLESSR